MTQPLGSAIGPSGASHHLYTAIATPILNGNKVAKSQDRGQGLGTAMKLENNSASLGLLFVAGSVCVDHGVLNSGSGSLLHYKVFVSPRQCIFPKPLAPYHMPQPD